MNKHTPGPWFVGISADDDQIHCIDASDPSRPGNLEVCKVWGTAKDREESEQSKANARLIAAAPDLYAEHKDWSEKFGAALMAVMQEDFGPITDLAMSMPFDFHKDGAPTLRSAALSKATGESNE